MLVERDGKNYQVLDIQLAVVLKYVLATFLIVENSP